jgi:alkylhydroperoxidase family enzyme
MIRTRVPAKHGTTPFGPALLAGLLLTSPILLFAEPRIAALPESRWNDAQRAVAESIPGRITNAVASYLHHPVLTANLMPFERYISSESTLQARDRELLILRTAWLARSNYVWAHRADAARRAGITAEELALIAHGPEAPGWDSREAALLLAVDELHADYFIADNTWSTLASHYSNEELVDLVFTVGEFTMIAGTVNSLRVEVESDLPARLPYGIPYMTSAQWTNERLIGKQARIAPLERDQWTPEIQRVLDPNDAGRPVANVYGTYIYSIGMDVPRRRVSEHIRNDTTLSNWQLELLLVRIGVLGRSEYEWAVHSRAARRAGMEDADIERIVAGPGAAGIDPVDDALLRATDEMYRDDYISDETWAMLDDAFDTQQLLDVLTTIGGYRMFAMAINTFGVQLDPNMMEARFPPHLR